MRASRSPGGSLARSPPRDAGRLRRGRPAVLGLQDLSFSARTYPFRVAASRGPELGAALVRPLTGYSLRRLGLSIVARPLPFLAQSGDECGPST